MENNIFKKYKYPLILLVLVLVFFWKSILFPNYSLYSPFSDLIVQDYLWKYLVHSTFQNYGELALWDPFIFGGMPYLANHFSKTLYPPNMLFMFFSNIAAVFNFLHIAHFFFAGLFMYLYARKIGLKDFSSFIVSAAYIFNSRAVMYVYAGLTNELPMLVFFPLTLYFFECFIEKGKLVFGILMGISLSMIILGAHTQMLVYTYFFSFVYFLFRSLVLYKNGKGASIKKVSSIYFLAIITSILLSSAQLLPSIEILKYDSRSKGLEYSFTTQGSFPPYHLITAIIPNFFGTLLHNDYWSLFPFWQLILFIGIVPLVLIPFAFRKRNYFVLFFSLLALLSLIFSFGSFNPLHQYFYKFIILLKYLRAPERILVFYFFAMSILCGFGIDRLLEKSNNDKTFLKRFVVLSGIIFAVSLLGFSGMVAFKQSILGVGNKILESKYEKSHVELNLKPISYYKNKIENNFNEIRNGLFIFLLVLFCTLLLLLALQKQRISLAIFEFLVTLLIIFELFSYGMPFIQNKGLDYVYTQKNIPTYLSQDKSYFRVLDLANSLPQESVIKYNLRLIGGYDGMVFEKYRKFVSEMAGIPFAPTPTIPIKEIKYPKMLDLLSVKYILSDKPLKEENYNLAYNHTVNVYTNNEKNFYFDSKIDDELFEFSNLSTDYVYKNNNALPEAFVVGGYIVADEDEILSIIKSKDFDPKKTVILEKDVGKKSNLAFKEVEVISYSTNEISINADLEDSGFLVLSEVWYPGWRAFDNGKEIKIYRANYIFRSVYLENGEHKVDFVFDPSSFKLGSIISLLTLAIVSVYLLNYYLREKRSL